ncbi:hypothetical protein LEP3755_26990 [Leptolyngbya sp. NIES-3755]|nr:hypothetical protein LEP3755_26990 [Leptolyngbya sp. NIES-3755]
MNTHISQDKGIEALQVTFTLPVVKIADAVQAEALENAKEAYVMTLLAAGEISSGKAANLLGVSRIEMFDRMGRFGISLFDDSLELEDLQDEIEQASRTLDKHSA